jgi:hypothetical protein
MEPSGSLLCSEYLATEPYTELDGSHILELRFQCYLPAVPRSPKFRRVRTFTFYLDSLPYVLHTMSLIRDIATLIAVSDLLCGLVVTVTGYRSRGPGFDSRRYQIF